MGKKPQPRVAVVMGSKSDWGTMQHATALFKAMDVPYLTRVISAHRTPDLLFDFAASARDEGFEVIIAAAGGAAHLPGMIAAKTTVPVLGVPIQSKVLNGLDSLLSIVQMPAGIPVNTLAIGEAGAVNAALSAISILANKDNDLLTKLQKYRDAQTKAVLDSHPLESVE